MSDKQTMLRDINKPYYNYFQALYLSFYSARLYIDVGKRWSGLAITYLLLICLIISLPFALRVILNFSNYFEKNLILPLKSIPPIYIQNGQLSLSKPLPYFIKNSAGKIIITIDTSKTVNQIDNSKYPDLYIAIAKDGLVYNIPNLIFGKNNKNYNQIDKIVFDQSMNQYFDPNQWVKSTRVKNLKRFTQIIIYPTIISTLFTLYFTLFLIIALLAQVIALTILRFSLSYQQALRLLIVAATPQFTVLMVALALNYSLTTILGLFLVGLIFIYFSFAVLSLKRDSTKLVQL